MSPCGAGISSINVLNNGSMFTASSSQLVLDTPARADAYTTGKSS